MADATIDLKVEAYLKAVLSTFAEGQAEASEALAMIAERVSDPAASLAFRLLAMRRYLRMGGHKVVAQWAWTAEHTQMQASSGGAKAMYDLARRTQEIFSQNNPGYSLAISPLRSLERQVSL